MIRVLTVIACALVIGLSNGGCRPSRANIELRKKNQELQAKVSELETQRAGDLARIRGLEAATTRPAIAPQAKLEQLYTAHGLSFGRLTGGYKENERSSEYSGVVVHVTPTDQEGQNLKAAGSFVVSVFDLAVPEKPLVGRREFSVEEAKGNWHGQALLFNYVLKVPFQIPPQHGRLLVRVEFADPLTGRVIVAEKPVTLKQ